MSNWVLWITGLLVATAMAVQPAAAKEAGQAKANAQVVELFRLGKFSEAAALSESVVAITEKELGPKHPNFATALNNLAIVYEAQGRYGEALLLHQRALAIREAVLPRNHPDIARSLSNLAVIYQRQARYAEAEPLYKRLLAIFEATIGPNHSDVATSLNNMGELYREQFRFTEAEQAYKRALVIREKVLGPNHPDLAQTLSNFAALYQTLERYAEAESYYKRSIAIYERAKGPDHADLVSPLNNFGELCRVLGRVDEAKSSLQRAIAILERQFGPNHPALANSLNNLANMETESGHFDDAERLVRRALAVLQQLPPDHPDIARIRNNLGEIYRRQGRLAEAEALMTQSMAALERSLGPDQIRVDQMLNNIARVNLAQEREADALAIMERLIPKAHYHPPLALSVLSRAEGKKLISAEKALDDALDVAEHASQTSASAAVNKLGARLSAGNDRLASLIRKDQDLMSEGEVLDKSVFSALSRDPSQRDAASERRNRERLVAIVQERNSLAKTLAVEFPNYVALSKPSPMAAREIQSLLSDDEALVLFFNFRDKNGDREGYVFAITRDAAVWRPSPLSVDALSQKIVAFRHGLDIDKIAAAANATDKAALFDLGLAHELYTSLFSDIEALVRDKKRLLIVPTGPLTALPFDLLVTEKPPAAIPAGFDGYRDAAWLIKRQAVSVLPSVTSLKVLRTFARNDRATRPMVGFGDPVFDFTRSPAGGGGRAASKSAARSLVAGAYTDFWQGAGVDRSKLAKSLPQLPDTADELNAVALKLGAPPGDIHLGLEASETLVKRAPLADYSVVYFATHGLVAGDVKGLGEPSLVLSLPKQPSDFDDGLLTSSEVAQLKLNADWVVLSACNTIAGDKPGAEALSGLARSFFYAGARALLVSHWAVDSEAASRLATSTFERLKSDPKIGRAEALRQSMLDYLNDRSQPRNAYPAFWGPFALIGEGASR